ncbi:methylmalonyl Co-A mutase-associated GTPase MeaB [Fibrella sp. HMF5335]|uniref:Methylmalonyl Co-A mutase-associated GTPase MeaB n=1 Tax=Fibrella rubiginis TaxID=2817060 RepID=A0A939K513_9BACT|nr:methylmalonyl Co-A mutase-associated GTPase MeaB [Fibrella rubiginis]MBO0937268.1 methylmalonyl Co-A mutase-associated GTPase MeaB [Fibrella rubiginis]
MRPRQHPSYYIDGLRAGDRLVLSRAITLVESQLPADQTLAQAVLEGVLPHLPQTSVRVGITGVPGVGKSTFIEAFGKHLTGLGKQLAVLTIDPTSQRSGGSILGDKTRMETLSMDPLAYIRPSPAGDSLGGVAYRTRETMLLCEAAGFDLILIETVGVGQSETLVHGMVDFFLLLMLAGAGDELQGMKRGIMELADALAITKADGDNIPAANRARLEYQNALHLFPPTDTGWQPPVVSCSALNNTGIAELWTMIETHQTLMNEPAPDGSSAWLRHRQQQALDWFRSLLRQRIEQQFFARPDIANSLAHVEKQVVDGTLLPTLAVDQLMPRFR